jgi:hypothetical protein
MTGQNELHLDRQGRLIGRVKFGLMSDIIETISEVFNGERRRTHQLALVHKRFDITRQKETFQ